LRRRCACCGDDHDRGVVLPLVALSLGFLIAITAITIDLGRLSLRRRDMQAVADMVALDMARLANGRTKTEILTATSPNWSTELSQSAARNGWTINASDAKLGNLVNGAFVESTLGTDRPTAVQITARDTLSYFFATGSGSVNRTSVASLGANVCFQLGSFAAAVSNNPNSLLGSLLGSALNATVVSYGGLANMQVNLGDLAAQLGFGTPTQLFGSTVKSKDVVIAEANALQKSGDAADATILNNIAAQMNGSSTVNFGNIVSVQQGGEQAALSTAVNAFDLLAGTAFLANGSNALSIPNLGVTVPGVSNLTASVQVIEAPQMGCGGVGGTAQTSQVRVTLNMNVSVLGLGVAAVQVTMNMASATGTLVAPLTCGPPAQANVSVAGSLVTTSIKQTLLGIPLTVTPASQGAGGSTVSFTIPPDTYNTFKRSGSGSIGLSGTTVTGLGLNAIVATALTSVFSAVDPVLIQPLSQYVGLEVAGADVRMLPSITCNALKLTL